MCLGMVGQVQAMGSPGCIEVAAGDWVLMASGLVLARLTEHEARDALELRKPADEELRGPRPG